MLNWPSWPAAGVCNAAVRVGTASAATASSVSVAIIRGWRESKCCTPWRAPPTTNASPSTSRLLARIEPIRAVCTTVTRPARSAKIATNSSGRLPIADWSTPVAPGPSRSPTCSVASLTMLASSASATADTTNVRTAVAPTASNTPARTVASKATPRTIRSFGASAAMRSSYLAHQPGQHLRVGDHRLPATPVVLVAPPGR